MIFIEKIDDLMPDVEIELVQNTAIVALKHQSVSDDDVDLTIVLTDDDQLHDLNNQWLGVDAATDVLSFPSDEVDPENGKRYLGDILISIPRADNQAKAAGHSVEAEVQLLITHGILHLMGHDHAEAEEKTRMWAAQAEILTQLGLCSLKIQEI